VDIRDPRNPAARDHRNIDGLSKRHRRLDIAAFEQPVAPDGITAS